MATEHLERVDTIACDIFGTVLDLAGGLGPGIERFLECKGTPVEPVAFWADWRARQRIEQFLDTLLMLGHGGYLDTVQKALHYTLRKHGLNFTDFEANELMAGYQRLTPFEDVIPGFQRLAGRYRLAALSNGDTWLLDALLERLPVEFAAVISVDEVRRFKPHPAVYRRAAQQLEREPGQILMAAAHSFDILGARACGFRGAYVNRYGLPFESSPIRPDLEARDFLDLAEKLGV